MAYYSFIKHYKLKKKALVIIYLQLWFHLISMINEIEKIKREVNHLFQVVACQLHQPFKFNIPPIFFLIEVINSNW